ncbi:hypothetical protein WJX81_006741 [Elliptochloris bilobata]|uniref:DNA-directed DNA polymerase family A palm domain-containing protein n=1 Tax=Elliptochloris bilobata TaxID=381761 RepID=A0AAW1S1Z2_9CHLO
MGPAGAGGRHGDGGGRGGGRHGARIATQAVPQAAAQADSLVDFDVVEADREASGLALPPAAAVSEALERAEWPAPASNGAPPAGAALQATSQASGAHEAKVSARPALVGLKPPPDVCVVDTPRAAERVAALLNGPLRDRVFACDTEVSRIDVTKESPCGHGYVTCLSIFCGPDVHFGEKPPGKDGVRQSQLWVDTLLLGRPGDEKKGRKVLAAFAPFFEDEGIAKVWHNYSFDRHVLANMGVAVGGFAGDTMHMARLWDSSRKGKGYSLETLSSDKDLMKGTVVGSDPRAKVSMKKIFGRPNTKKDGTPGKLVVLPAVEELQTGADTRGAWIDYSAHDARATAELRQALATRLAASPCTMDKDVRDATGHGGEVYTMLDLYNDYWRPFGALLTDMEKAGMMVNREHLAAGEVRALQDQEDAKTRFRRWAAARVPAAEQMNICSGPQIRQLLFPGVPNRKPDAGNLEMERVFKVPNDSGVIEEGRKLPKKQVGITLWGAWGRGVPCPLVPDVYTPSGWPAVSTPVLRALAGKPGAAKKALAELDGANLAVPEGEVPVEEMMADPAVAALAAAGDGGDALATLSADANPADLADWPKKGYGHLYAAFGGGRAGLEACAAVDALCEVGAIDTLLSNFMRPLQGDAISTSDGPGRHRVHCSLNINTETGRLSARRPNLQNQPALEKDRYKVRKAFTADVEKGNTLVVADYGQLELRLLAHMASCRSMREAFELGGDFHSRTALNMYDHIQQAVTEGACLLEWDGGASGHEPPPVPLLKDMFGSERRKAKVLNFSIAYGKTAHGLARDWGTSLAEAEETVERWYSDRPEVREWQRRQRKLAMEKGFVRTLLGRERRLPDARQRGAAQGHALRAAINTPIQGSAADVATAAMLTIARNERLRDLGWTMLLQVHDEVILEGPKESAEEAQALVVACMERPFAGQNPLSVDLVVDSNVADTWYDAK